MARAPVAWIPMGALEFHAVPAAGLTLKDPTVGETGLPIAVADLEPERGFYVRRQQTAELWLPEAVDAGPHEVDLVVALAGVTDDGYVEMVRFT